MKLQNRVLVITGGGNGVGRELVLQALARGARVAAIDLRGDSLAQLADAANAGERLSTHVLDITNRPAVAALPAQVIARHGTVDGLINNAGIIQPFADISELDPSRIDRVIDVNLHGTLNMVTAFLPTLLARPQAHIANVASMGAFLPVPGQSIYCATKAAVRLFSEGLYGELLDTKVGVSVIMPGAIATSIAVNSDAGAPPGVDADGKHGTSPSKVAQAILKAIERNRLHVIVGLDARVMHWAMRMAPKPTMHAVRMVLRRVLKLDRKPLPSVAPRDDSSSTVQESAR